MQAANSPHGVIVDWNFEPYEAFWLVVGPSQPDAPATDSHDGKIVVDISSHGRVWFDSSDQPNPAQHQISAPQWMQGQGANRRLESWLDWGLGEFAGFIDYETSFQWDADSSKVTLDLGQVEHIAEVRINGKFIGAQLWAPFRFDLTPEVLIGTNTVHIRVGNLLVNAVNQYERYPWKWYDRPQDKQAKAGLFGPVTVTHK